jgi:hypothetical protein
MERQIETVELTTPITVYGEEVNTITLRKPTAGELRGVKLWELLQMDISAVRQVVPRIATPHMSPEDFDKLEPIDLLNVTSACLGFFMAPSVPM